MPAAPTRRRFLTASAALPFALRAFAATKTPQWLLLGTGTEKGILRATFDPISGDLGAFESAAATSHPSFLALHPSLPLLYAANEMPEGDGALSSFRLDRATANLTPLQQLSTQGNGPCYVSIDRTGHAAFAANYGGGSLASFSLTSGGQLGHPASVYACKSNPACGTLGPVRSRQDAAHMHCAVVSPDNSFVLVCNLGEDSIEVFPVRPGELPVSVALPQRIPTRPGSGPRHLAFHPNGRWLYCIHELDCTLELFDWTPHATPVLSPRQNSLVSTLSGGTLPNAESAHPNTACELVISPNGRFLYANTRGANTLAVYAIDSATGLLTEQQRIGTYGDVTRHFAFDPTRQWLLCANQGSSTITVLSHNPATGHLHETLKSFPVDTPMFLQFL